MKLLRSNLADRGAEGGPGSGSGSHAWERWPWAWHLGFYALLVLATVLALADPTTDGGTWPRAIPLALALGALYAITVMKHPEWEQKPAELAYLAPAMLLWLLLTGVHPAYYLLLFALYTQTFSLLPMRWAIPTSVALTVVVAWRNIAEAPEAAPEVVLSGAVSLAFGTLLALWIGSIIRQSRDRRRLIEELEATRKELADGERRAGVLEERSRVAREIHDTLAQGFVSIVTRLEAAEGTLKPGQTEARRHLDRARRTARESLAESRRLVAALRPELLEGSSLTEVLGQVTERWSEEAEIPVAVSVTGEQHALPPEAQVTLLRTAQEALANVRRHANANRVDVTLSYMEDVVALDVQDDGEGFDPDKVSTGLEGGFGLKAMRERVEQLGGRLLVESTPGEGTTLVVELPAVAADEPAEAEPARGAAL